MPRTPILALLILLWIVPGADAFQALEGGAARVSISPPVDKESGVPHYLDGSPVWMAGYAPGRAATALHDDLYARALVLGTGDKRIAVVSLDLVGFFLHDVQDARYLLPDSLGIDHLVVSATHNHEAPDALGLWGYFNIEFPFFHLGHDRLYLENVKLAIVEAVGLAVKDVQPIRLRPARASTDGLNLIHDSRTPAIIDEQVNILHAQDEEGGAVFTLINWANHPEALGADNTSITADFPKWICDEVEESLGGTVVYTSGSLGGLLAPEIPAHTFEAAEAYGRQVGALVVEAIDAQPRAVPSGTLVVDVDDQVDVFFFNPLFRLMNYMSASKRHERDLVNCGPMGRVCLDVRTEVNYIALDTPHGRIFDLVTVPGEMVSELWYDVQKEMHGYLSFMIGLGNDELGYILPVYRYECSEENPRDCWPTEERDYRWPRNPLVPGDHYEETMSVGVEMGPVIFEALSDIVSINRPGVGQPSL